MPAKSGLSVSADVSAGVGFQKTSSEGSTRVSSRPARSSSACTKRMPGTTSSPRPCRSPASPVRRPVRARSCVRLKETQPCCSLSRPCQRVMLKPQASRAGSNESDLNGIAVSAVHPPESRRAAASQMPSHSQFWRSTSVKRPSLRMPFGFTSNM